MSAEVKTRMSHRDFEIFMRFFALIQYKDHYGKRYDWVEVRASAGRTSWTLQRTMLLNKAKYFEISINFLLHELAKIILLMTLGFRSHQSLLCRYLSIPILGKKMLTFVVRLFERPLVTISLSSVVSDHINKACALQYLSNGELPINRHQWLFQSPDIGPWILNPNQLNTWRLENKIYKPKLLY